MASAVIMPQIGQDIESGRIIEWKVREGDVVESGDIVAVVESEKATFELESPADGTVLKLLYPAEGEAPVLSPIAYVGRAGDSVPSTADRRGGRPPASPALRRFAREQGIDLAGVTGTGPGGRMRKQDVLAAAQTTPGDESVPFDRMRRRISKRMTRSKQDAPHFYLLCDVDVSELNARRARVTVTDILIQATACALTEFPRLNAHVDDERVLLKKHVNLGVATAVENGLLVPVVPDAAAKSLEQISVVRGQNMEDARRGVEDAGISGTFTISNLGKSDVTAFVPIINPPECAILGVGSIHDRAVVVQGEIVVREIMTLALSCDHRAVDGAYAAAFLADLKQRLENWTDQG